MRGMTSILGKVFAEGISASKDGYEGAYGILFSEFESTSGGIVCDMGLKIRFGSIHSGECSARDDRLFFAIHAFKRDHVGAEELLPCAFACDMKISSYPRFRLASEIIGCFHPMRIERARVSASNAPDILHIY